jgi:hypothetical protein
VLVAPLPTTTGGGGKEPTSAGSSGANGACCWLVTLVVNASCGILNDAESTNVLLLAGNSVGERFVYYPCPHKEGNTGMFHVVVDPLCSWMVSGQSSIVL